MSNKLLYKFNLFTWNCIQQYKFSWSVVHFAIINSTSVIKGKHRPSVQVGIMNVKQVLNKCELSDLHGKFVRQCWWITTTFYRQLKTIDTRLLHNIIPGEWTFAKDSPSCRQKSKGMNDQPALYKTHLPRILSACTQAEWSSEINPILNEWLGYKCRHHTYGTGWAIVCP